jgi:hypothetical protein
MSTSMAATEERVRLAAGLADRFESTLIGIAACAPQQPFVRGGVAIAPLFTQEGAPMWFGGDRDAFGPGQPIKGRCQPNCHDPYRWRRWGAAAFGLRTLRSCQTRMSLPVTLSLLKERNRRAAPFQPKLRLQT